MSLCAASQSYPLPSTLSSNLLLHDQSPFSIFPLCSSCSHVPAIHTGTIDEDDRVALVPSYTEARTEEEDDDGGSDGGEDSHPGKMLYGDMGTHLLSDISDDSYGDESCADNQKHEQEMNMRQGASYSPPSIAACMTVFDVVDIEHDRALSLPVLEGEERGGGIFHEQEEAVNNIVNKEEPEVGQDRTSSLTLPGIPNDMNHPDYSNRHVHLSQKDCSRKDSVLYDRQHESNQGYTDLFHCLDSRRVSSPEQTRCSNFNITNRNRLETPNLHLHFTRSLSDNHKGHRRSLSPAEEAWCISYDNVHRTRDISLEAPKPHVYDEGPIYDPLLHDMYIHNDDEEEFFGQFTDTEITVSRERSDSCCSDLSSSDIESDQKLKVSKRMPSFLTLETTVMTSENNIPTTARWNDHTKTRRMVHNGNKALTKAASCPTFSCTPFTVTCPKKKEKGTKDVLNTPSEGKMQHFTRSPRNKKRNFLKSKWRKSKIKKQESERSFSNNGAVSAPCTCAIQ